MRKYGKLINGYIVQAPLCIEDGDTTIYNPSAEYLTAKGYLPLIETPCPETEGDAPTHYAAHWQETGGAIVQVWVEEELTAEAPAEEEPSLQEQVDELRAALLALIAQKG